MRGAMKVGAVVPLGGPNANPEFLAGLGIALEERGFESVWIGEHVVLFDRFESRYPYADDGSFPFPSEFGILEPLTGLAYLAAVTHTLRLGTGICLAGQRNPVYTAKQVADVDVLSGGRVEFGVGMGWLREEYEALGMSGWEDRGDRARDHLKVMRSLWADEVSEYQGDYYRLPKCRMYPKPVQRPHPPIHIGGESDAALRRVADLGDGWFSFNRGPDEVPAALVRLDRFLEERGRHRHDITVSVCPGLKECDRAAVQRYKELGVDRVIVVVPAFDRDQLLTVLDYLASELLAPTPAAT